MQTNHRYSPADADNGPFDNLGDLFEKAKDYAETRVDLFKLRATKQASEIASGTASSAVFLLLMAISLMVINIGLALLIGDWLGKTYYGFFIVGIVYLIAGFIFKAVRKSVMEEPITNAIIQKIYNTDDDEVEKR